MIPGGILVSTHIAMLLSQTEYCKVQSTTFKGVMLACIPPQSVSLIIPWFWFLDTILKTGQDLEWRRLLKTCHYTCHLNFDTFVNTCNTSPKICPSATIMLSSSCESGLSNHFWEVWLTGELPDRLDKILIRLTITCKDRSKKWYHREWILVI